jgi:hypothetical protein
VPDVENPNQPRALFSAGAICSLHADLIPTDHPPRTVLEALDHLPAQHLRASAQVSVVLQVSIRWLEEQRASSKPPLWLELGLRVVRYAAEPLRIWMQSLIDGTPRPTLKEYSARLMRLQGWTNLF